VTWEELANAILKLSSEQRNSTVTVELGVSDECYPADLRICDIEHESLDENHPVVYVKDA